MVSHALEVCLEAAPGGPDSRWPFLATRPVAVGGMTVTYAQAQSALRALEASGGAAVAQVLRATGNPLAACDYHTAAAPFMQAVLEQIPAAAQSAGGRKRGAAGFPVVKLAFAAALRAALAVVEAAEPARHHAGALQSARSAFSRDFGYAEAMARSAVGLREREHVARLRQVLATGVSAATAACRTAGPSASPCTVVSACGTGACRFASGVLADLQVPAGPGRLVRPPAHAAAGTGFGLSSAAAELAELVPLTVGVTRSSADTARASERACA